MKNIIVAVTGASGSIYARQLVEVLLRVKAGAKTGSGVVTGDGAKTGEAGEANSIAVGRLGLIVSRRGEEVAAWEGVEFPTGLEGRVEPGFQTGTGLSVSVESRAGSEFPPQPKPVERFSNDDMFASPASGSARWDAMVIVPCSMGCVGRIASGVSSDLISRAADVMLKEGRELIVVPRETPLNLIHLQNLTTIARAGGVVMPASPSFYSRPADLEAACMTLTERIVARLGIDCGGYRWGASE